MMYNIRVDKTLMKSIFIMSYKHLLPWASHKDIWIVGYPRLLGGMGLSFDSKFVSS